MSGKVYLVGAGPGRLAYLTVQGHQLLQQAEVLVHDALVSDELRSLILPTCQQFDVGKRGGGPSTPQAEINQLLVQQCQQGKQVVRLKSGDPFIFGRTQAEIQALKAADCAFEVVPGVSSALAAPLLAGIPLTDPVLSHSFTVLTGHDLDLLNWELLAGLETLVFLMGARSLAEITRRLVSHGMRSETPVALIRWASQPQQQIWQGTLLNIVQLTRAEKISPSVIVVGEVVRLRQFLQTETPVATRNFPLAGKTVLVTRSSAQSSQFGDLLIAQGASLIEMPALEIRPPSSWVALDQAIAELKNFHWLVLTSANAVSYFFERLHHCGQDARSLAGLKIAVVGKKTAAVLKQHGLRPDFIPPHYVADALVETFSEPASGLRLLFPRVESGGREVLVKDFTAQGAEVIEVAAYESGCPAAADPAVVTALEQRQIDIITFASSKTVDHTCQLLEQALGDRWQRFLDGLCIASIGPQTSQACYDRIGRVDAEATEYTLEGLTQAVAQWAS